MWISIFHFLGGKDLGSHINVTYAKPTVTKETTETTELAQWKIDNAKIISWILSFVDQPIVLNLWPYRTEKGMSEYLKSFYNQDHAAKQF